MNLGSGKQILSLGVFLVLILSAYGQDGRSYTYRTGNGTETSSSVSPDGTILISYSLPEFRIEGLDNEIGKFYRISVPGHVHSADTGMPELPVYSRLISIPAGTTYRIRVTGVKSTRIRPSARMIEGILYPAQESAVKRETGEKRRFSFNKKAYSSKSYLGSDTVAVTSLGKARNINIASVNISPFRYNPRTNSLEIIMEMKIEISFTGKSILRSSAESVAFSSMASKGILNYSMDLIPHFTDKPAGMIILTDTAFRKQLQPFIKWKTQKGFRLTVLYKGAAFAGTTYTELKDTISKIYNSATEATPAPDYLLIIGDIDRVPCFRPTYYNTDMYYGEFDGNGDYFPEMFVGRIPASDTLKLRSAIEKIIQYEKFGFSPTNTFYSKALTTTGYDNAFSVFMNGQVNYAVSKYMKPENKITESHFNHSSMLSDYPIRRDSIKKLINNGTSFINYSGHGSMSSWVLGSSRIDTSDVTALQNKYMYPLIISNACQTAQFYSSNSFGNKMLLSKFRGAIGFIGCSEDSYWDEDYYWAIGAGPVTENPAYEGKGLGMFDRLFHTHNELPGEWYMTLGQINYSGNMAVSSSTTAKKKYYWETYNVIGDPSLTPFIGTPGAFTISLPDTLPNNIRSLSLILEPFSYAAISHFDTLWDATFAGVSGSAILNIPPVTEDSCLVVITRQNRRPLIKTIYFSDIKNEFINLTSTRVNDSEGNNNGKADYGEKFFLSLQISNLGFSDAGDVYASISSSSEWITIERDSFLVGTLASLTETTIADKLEITTAGNVPDRAIAPVDVFIKSGTSEKHYIIDLQLHSPDLKILGCLVDDSQSGNNDRIPDPGETFNLLIRIQNQGTSDASGQLTLNSQDSGITIFDPDVKSGTLSAGQISDIPLLVSLSPAMMTGDYLTLNSTLNCDPFIVSREFTLRTGKVRETFEAMSFDIFPWINNSTIPWTFAGTGAFEGSLSARSGITPDGGQSLLQIKTFYPHSDTLKFWCNVSSEKDYDYLTFTLNGKEMLRRSGDFAWTKIVIPVPAGLNIMEWKYRKDISKSSGADCARIDLIDFTVSGPVVYIRKDLMLQEIITPLQQDDYGKETVSVKIMNTGRDTLNGFNLAYSVNDRIYSQQFFNNIVAPGGDATVAFNARLDMSRYGIYSIKTYGVDNMDNYLLNDTASIHLENLTIDETLTVFPNPFREDLTVFINSQTNDRIVLTISNTAGKILYSSERNILKGENDIVIDDIDDFIPGIYYLRISGTRIMKTFAVLKVKR